MPRNAMTLAILATAVPIACATAVMETAVPIEVKNTKNCYRLSPELYRSGQPGEDGFKALEKLGLKSILNLREYHSDTNEAKHTGLRLYRIKLAAGKVTREELMNCLLVIDSAAKPILVHCWHGSDRTGIVCAAYRIVIQGWAPEQALEELMDERFGHHRSYYSNLAKLVRATDWKVFKEEFRKKRQAWRK
ncbi:protein tyrosine phosphatase [Akkermansia muciniphila]|uniref:fused DSP-PTPase phosphatase/NAD kinase-like protein n=1 Tax=Akkermansia muciniphila TaxID=239935 RepID=UPI000C9CA81E|nr:tyrosine-protein phosphatase [Akkermansia muciniphila]PNC94740.1 protein tyrosine phosphatase [Akkermansia muciniphila]